MLCMLGRYASRLYSWACKHETTRVEDEAYCLLGIFGTNMTMLYGEGGAAVIRLRRGTLSFSSITAFSPREQALIRKTLRQAQACWLSRLTACVMATS